MPGIHFLSIFLVTSLHAVFQTKILEEPTNINEYGTSTTKLGKEDYNYFVDTQTNIIWYRFLAYKVMKVRLKKVKISHTTPMQKQIDVTESSTIGYVRLEDTASPFNSDEDENITTSMSDIELNFKTSELLPEFVYDDNIFITKLDIRRQAGYRPPPTRKAKPVRYINARLPYWEYGHKMFEGTTERTRTAAKTTKERWRNVMNDFNDCNPSCIYFYITYGKVCGHRYNTKNWKNEYMNFENMCEMDKENCKEDTKNWHPMYRGECGELNKFVGVHLDYETILKRKELYDNFSYVPPTATLTPDELEDNLDKIIKSQIETPAAL